MGARGPIQKYPFRLPLRFSRGVETQMRMIAKMDGVSLGALVRRFVKEGLDRRLNGEERRVGELVAAAQKFMKEK